MNITIIIHVQCAQIKMNKKRKISVFWFSIKKKRRRKVSNLQLSSSYPSHLADFRHIRINGWRLRQISTNVTTRNKLNNENDLLNAMHQHLLRKILMMTIANIFNAFCSLCIRCSFSFLCATIMLTTIHGHGVHINKI